MMTETEAATKWCPLARSVRESPVTEYSRCIGSGCMAWRIAEKDLGPDFPAKGYCGIAGKL